MRVGSNRRVLVFAGLFVTACAGGELATTSFGEVGDDTGVFGDDDTASLDPSTTGTEDPTASSGDTSSSGDPDTGDTTDTGSICEDEICDGLDNDCDDEVDEGCTCASGDVQSCYSGPEGTPGTGACVEGTQTCGAEGSWGSCDGEVVPTDESCNGGDDDCDGETDEGFEAETCGQGICHVTVETCVDGEPVECVPLPADPSESCNGIDDDCDDDIDEGCSCTDGDTQPCYAGPMGTENVGACHGGTQTCADGAWGDCIGAVVPTGESCNAIDDDCDTLTDENNPQGGAQCNTGLVGVCAIGHQQCNAGALGCVADSLGGAEICDGLDNDCDTGIDEGNPGGGAACNTGQQGVCAAGIGQCMNGALQCVQTTQSSAEVCDALDNDCDGSVNEGNPGAGQACNTGFPGQCGPGTTACSGGGIVCNQNAAASAEVCDAIDNDCDLGVDEGNPGGGQFCFTGLLGNCMNGTTACSGGAVVCNATTPAGPEVCGNGADEDCDGTADDGCGCAHDTCTTGAALASDCSPCVGSVCAVDPFCCGTSWDSLCVNRVLTVCGTYSCPSHQGSCAHSLCATGGALASGCDAGVSNCVAQICGVDPFCCNFSWDAQCVGEVASICGFTCA